jgi:hypothetical protein
LNVPLCLIDTDTAVHDPRSNDKLLVKAVAAIHDKSEVPMKREVDSAYLVMGGTDD